MEKIVIAGGTSGMGLATAIMLSRRDYQVTILGRSREKLDKALLEIGRNGKGVIADAADAAGLKLAMDDIGPFDHLVIALSGGRGIGLFRELNLAELREGFEGKFFPQLAAAQAALPFIRPTGSITFITSISSRSRAPGTAGLGAINGALETMVPTLAKELKPLRINALAPGVINTAWWDFMTPQKKQETFDQYAINIPLGRIGETQDVAKMIVAFIENDYITGQVIAVDGGLSLV